MANSLLAATILNVSIPEIRQAAVTCPECGKGELIQRRNKKGNIFYSCKNCYPNVNLSVLINPFLSLVRNVENPYLVE